MNGEIVEFNLKGKKLNTFKFKDIIAYSFVKSYIMHTDITTYNLVLYTQRGKKIKLDGMLDNDLFNIWKNVRKTQTLNALIQNQDNN